MKKRIAVIGSGIAGLTSGWLCREAGAERSEERRVGKEGRSRCAP